MSHSAPAAADAVTLAGNRPSLSVRIAWLLLALAAAINIVVAVVLATGDSRRASDLHTMYEWCRAWLIAGRSLYTGPNAVTDYPPHAIVWLAPIATVPRRWIVPLWTAMAVVLTPLLPWLVMRSAARRATGPMTIAIPVLLYLCWAAPRTLLQFSVLSLTLASLSALIADERPIVSGLTLGLALFKPHIAGPVALWMMISGRLRPILIAAAIVIGGLLLYDTRIGESPLTTALAWGSVIRSEYAGSDGFVWWAGKLVGPGGPHRLRQLVGRAEKEVRGKARGDEAGHHARLMISDFSSVISSIA